MHVVPPSPSASPRAVPQTPNSDFLHIQPAPKHWVDWSFIGSGVATVIMLAVMLYYNHETIVLQIAGQEATLLNTIVSEYSGPEMMDAFMLLERFRNRYQKDYVEEFIRLKKSNDVQGDALDHARRRIFMWYSKLTLFEEFDLLPRKYLIAFPGRDRTASFLALVVPLELASCSLAGVHMTDAVERLCEIFDITPCDFESGAARRMTGSVMDARFRASSEWKSRARDDLL